MRLAGLAFLVGMVAGTSGAFAGDADCHLTAADKAANAKLNFDAFDQKGVTSVTWRKLEERGCHAQAVAAAEDYLVEGPVLAADEKQDVLFHIGQSFAFWGREVESAHFVAAAIPPDRGNHGELDWTTYLVGTWAFLVKDKPLLDVSAAKLSAEKGDGNVTDSAALRGLAKCFRQPYRTAYVDCRPK
jgi:hypothetical protein